MRRGLVDAGRAALIPAPTDTIVAASSPPGGGERAVVRLSGARARAITAEVFSGELRTWRWTPGPLTLPGWPPAPAAVLFFAAPRSYTGEDVVELWIPGAPPLLRRLLLELEGRGARPAERGEFTRRAFLAGRLDLTQVEAVLALTRSEDAREARSALRALQGGTRARIDALKQALLTIRAHVEAAIDFTEEDLDLTANAELARRVDDVRLGVDALLAAAGRAPQARTEPVVALRGPANAGKSTLFNALTGLDAALIADREGTTRDVLEGRWRLGGRPVRLLDTAGDKASAGGVEAGALEHAQRAAEGADLVLWVTGPDQDAPAPDGALAVSTKADLLEPKSKDAGLRVSAHTGVGLDALAAAVAERLFARAPATELTGSARQEGLLRRAAAALEQAAAQLRGEDPAVAELAAVDLQDALDALGALTGEVTTEDVLGEIFAGFCIGK